MRTIKFRILVSDGWKYFTLDDLLSGMYLGVEIDNDKMLAKCQFTGLLDKNGKEIYEGDIIQFPPSWEGASGMIVEVFWGSMVRSLGWKEKRWYNGKELSTTELDGEFIERIGEVIGNVWENPSLLKEKI